ncbi:MAG: quinone-dependent dihydroorotate dehydrogenase [archaeon]
MYKIIRPLLFRADPEYMHTKTLELGKKLSNSKIRNIIDYIYGFEDERLNVNVLGFKFKNPIGLAAGFDKNGDLVDFLPSLGFGFLEIGSITALAREGNEKPRLFRLEKDKALINRLGLNNEGADSIYEKLKDREFKVPLFINISKTNDPSILYKKAVDDFLYSFKKIYDIVDIVTINISCPNTKDGKTFEERSSLEELISKLTENNPLNKKLLIKISPDILYSKLEDIFYVAEKYNIDGYVISNTSLSRTDLKTSSRKIERIGRGGLSGQPIKQRSTNLIKYIKFNYPDKTIIGVGGIFSAQDAYEKLKAGASLIQIYTGLIYEGPGLVKKIKKDLVKILENQQLIH